MRSRLSASSFCFLNNFISSNRGRSLRYYSWRRSSLSFLALEAWIMLESKREFSPSTLYYFCEECCFNRKLDAYDEDCGEGLIPPVISCALFIYDCPCLVTSLSNDTLGSGLLIPLILACIISILCRSYISPLSVLFSDSKSLLLLYYSLRSNVLPYPTKDCY